ncbi:jg12676 [Pararge aegeria aegeria]|uniref:Jg12676 protein n=1 Tax=Pararge aegeria aegeria TaxID=348720 RepID=A0A8S4QPF3_9NEOP|nr:jg12676 [Pararge aegeria aegeria]
MKCGIFIIFLAIFAVHCQPYCGEVETTPSISKNDTGPVLFPRNNQPDTPSDQPNYSTSFQPEAYMPIDYSKGDKLKTDSPKTGPSSRGPVLFPDNKPSTQKRNEVTHC